MGYNPRENVCELFDFECTRKNDKNVYMWKCFNNFIEIKFTSKPYTDGVDTLRSVV